MSNPKFQKELLDSNQDFNIDHTKQVFSLAKIEDQTCIQELIQKIKIKKEESTAIDFPIEFLDPLLCTPIKNPVILPITNTIMDRDVIERYLLEKQENPFDRSELNIDILNNHNETEIAKMSIEDFLSKLNEWFCTTIKPINN